MPAAYPVELRERAVAAYEAGEGTYEEIAERFDVSVASLVRWVSQRRATGAVTPRKRGGGWHSPVDGEALDLVVEEHPDSTVAELTRAYNRRVARRQRVHRSSILRALHRAGYVFKKNVPGPRSSSDSMSS